MNKPRSAIKTIFFAADQHREKIDHLGDPLAKINLHIDFTALAAVVDRVAPCPVSSEGGRPPLPTETMVRILVLKRLYNLSDEQLEHHLLDRMSYQRFYGLTQVSNIPDRATILSFENWLGEAGAQVLFDGVTDQLLERSIRWNDLSLAINGGLTNMKEFLMSAKEPYAQSFKQALPELREHY